MGNLNFARLAQLIAWAAIAFIAYATLTRVGFVYSIYFKLAPFLMQIGMRKYAAVEHFVAFAVSGALFSFAYPRRTVTICCVVFGAAIALELAQTMTPDRHGTVVDAIQKISGGAFGILAARFAIYFWSIRQSGQTEGLSPTDVPRGLNESNGQDRSNAVWHCSFVKENRPKAALIRDDRRSAGWQRGL